MNQYYFRKQTFQGLKHYALSGCSRPARFLLLFTLALCFAFTPEAQAQLTPQFQKQGGTSPSRNGFPLNSTGVKRHQNFYYAQELTATAPGNATQATSGLVTRVYFRAHAATSGTYTNFKVNLGQTTANSFPGASNNEFFGNLTNVFSSPSHTLTATNAGDWVAIDLTTPYLYDAGQPLIVEIEMTGKTNGGIDATTSSAPNNRRVYTSTVNAVTGSTDRTWLDFGIDVASTPPCTTPPTAGIAITSVTYICPNADFQLNLTGASVGSDITYQWQSSADGTSNWTNIAGANASSLVTSQPNTTYYRAVTTCSGISVTSNSVVVTTTPTPFNGVYTINKNAPFTPNSNYTSFADLIQDLTCRGVSGPVTINLVPGSGPYNEQVIIPEIQGASATNTITFNGNGDSLKDVVTSANRSIFRLDGADFITISNFKLVTQGTSYGWGIQLSNGADNNTITNNTILLDAVTSTSEANSGGIVFTNGNGALTAGNTGNNNQIFNNTISGGFKGVHLAGIVSGTGNNQIRNNQIRNTYGYGILLDAAVNNLIEGNDISRPASTTTASTFSGIELKGHSAGNTLAKNRIYNTHNAIASPTGTAHGIYFNANDAPAGAENIVKNNLIYNLNNTGSTYGIYNSGSDGTYIYHNTIVLEGNKTSTTRGFYQTTEAFNVKFNNNLVYMGGTGTGARHAIYLGALTSVVTSENNAIYLDPAITANSHVGYYAIAHTTFADWQMANGGAYDQLSVYSDPLFENVAAANFAPTNSMLNDISPALAAVTDDINGAPRTTTTDPGAFEFTPVGNDAGIAAIISPSGSIAPNTQQAVEISIKNFGADPLTSLTINWSVNGVAQTPFNWTGTLAGGQTSAPIAIGNFTFVSGAYNLEFCAASPNGTTDSNALNDCRSSSVYACAPLAGTYTIDQNQPASATNFQSLAAAAESLNNCGISAAVTFNVVSASGPYTGQIALTSIAGASATNTVTFNGNGNTVSFAGNSNSRAVVKLDGTDFVTFTGFVIEATDLAYGWGIHLLNGADNNVISNNTINIAAVGTIEANSVGIIFSNASSAVTVAGNTGNANVISGNTITGGYKGIHLNGDLNQPGGNQIINNTILDFYSDGIRLNAAKGTLVEGNDISRPTREAITTFTGIELTGNSKQNIISKNRIHNTHGGAVTSTQLNTDVYGIYFLSNDAPAGEENIVKNNLIYNTNNLDLIYGIYNSGSDGTHIYHNTLDLSNVDNAGTVRGFYQTTTATNIRFMNNIVSIASSSAGKKHGIYIGAIASTITSNYNVLYVPAGFVGYLSGDILTLAAWKAAGNNAYDQNSVSADPIYNNAATGNFTPNALIIDNIGLPITNVTDDINGAPRSTTTPDVGAYEFSVPVDNVGIVAISGPASDCGLSAAETITVTIRNYGTSTQTNIPVSYSVNGVSIAAPETFVGSLAYNATATFTFSAKADMSVAGTYVIEATTLLPSDNDTSNDAFSLAVTNALLAGSNVALDFETAANGLDALRKVVSTRSNIYYDSAASYGANSFRGMIMDGVDHSTWNIPSGINTPWTNNPEHFSGVYMCVVPQSVTPNDSLILTFDLKQLYKGTHYNTNFRVTVNGQQIGKNYNPPFGGYDANGANWTSVKIDLTPYLGSQGIQIGLESSVKEGFDNGKGTANLLDNINLTHYRGTTTGVKADLAANAISVYPNPNNGTFNVKLNGYKQAATLEVYNLAGQLIATENVNAGVTEKAMNLNGLAAGTYLVKVTSENTVKVTRLIVQ